MIVKEELGRLEQLSDAAFNSVNRFFEEVGEVLEKKRLDLVAEVRRKREDKMRVLEHQLKEIEAERSEVRTQAAAAQHLDTGHSVAQRITDLNTKLDCIRLETFNFL